VLSLFRDVVRDCKDVVCDSDLSSLPPLGVKQAEIVISSLGPIPDATRSHVPLGACQELAAHSALAVTLALIGAGGAGGAGGAIGTAGPAAAEPGRATAGT
jgi:hypothetical protein